MTDDSYLRGLLGAAPNLTGGKDSVTYIREKRDKLEAAIEAKARVIHEAWYHEMVRQGRKVAPERAHWETLEERDRDIDRAIARQVLAAACATEGEQVVLAWWKCGRCGGTTDWEADAPPHMYCDECNQALAAARPVEPFDGDEPPWPGWFSCCDCYGWFSGEPVAYESSDEVCAGCAARRAYPVFLNAVRAEVDRARAIHRPLHSPHEAYAVILEELLEFRAEVFKKHPFTKAMRTELIHTAAMCQRATEDVMDQRTGDSVP